jgi:hypothetical protein
MLRCIYLLGWLTFEGPLYLRRHLDSAAEPLKQQRRQLQGKDILSASMRTWLLHSNFVQSKRLCRSQARLESLFPCSSGLQCWISVEMVLVCLVIVAGHPWERGRRRLGSCLLLPCTYMAGACWPGLCLNSCGFSRFASCKVAHLGSNWCVVAFRQTKIYVLGFALLIIPRRHHL